MIPYDRYKNRLILKIQIFFYVTCVVYWVLKLLIERNEFSCIQTKTSLPTLRKLLGTVCNIGAASNTKKIKRLHDQLVLFFSFLLLINVLAISLFL